MRITNVAINGIKNPMGFSYGQVTCSWNVQNTKSKTQKNVKIEVSRHRDFDGIIYQKEGENLSQSGEILEVELQPRTTYYYRITVVGDEGDWAVSEAHTFETGKMGEHWDADWVAPKEGDAFHPLMKKVFSVSGAVKRARLYASGVGLFEAYLNGEKIGEEYLTPYVSNYERNIQVITFPVEKMLLENQENELEFLLGKGWYMGVFGLEMQKENYGNKMAAIAELFIEYENGVTECIKTDGSWRYRGSDIEESGIYFGEICNRLLWREKENPWRKVEVLDNPGVSEGTENIGKSRLMDRLSLPVLVKERIQVKEILYTPAGETVLDMGQNFAGYVEFKADFPIGTKITLDFGEILQGGNFYNKNYREAQSQFIYISNGKPETARVHFTFFGFRYVRIIGWPGECRREDFIGNVMYSDIRRTGYISTGNEKINRLYENTVWGLKSNFIP